MATSAEIARFKKRQEELKASRARTYRERKWSGQCVQCGNDALVDHVKCAVHAELDRKWHAENAHRFRP